MNTSTKDTLSLTVVWPRRQPANIRRAAQHRPLQEGGSWRQKSILTVAPGLLSGPPGVPSWQVGQGRIIKPLPQGGEHHTVNLLCRLDELPEFSAWYYDTISCSLIVSGSEHHSVYIQQLCEFVYTGGHQMSGERREVRVCRHLPKWQLAAALTWETGQRFPALVWVLRGLRGYDDSVT